MTPEQVIEVILQKKWVDLGPQKMKVMRSFKKGKYRLNYYTTTDTITIQDVNKRFDKGDIYNFPNGILKPTLEQILK